MVVYKLYRVKTLVSLANYVDHGLVDTDQDRCVLITEQISIVNVVHKDVLRGQPDNI